MSNYRRDTGAAKMPSIPKVNITDPALSQWARAVTEWVEVRTGSRGNEAERAVTKRELDEITGRITNLTSAKTAQPGEVIVDLGGGMTASIAIDKFIESIRNTRLYKDLMKRLDDPSRFDHLASEIREVLLKSLIAEAAKRGAAIERTETLIQDTNRSLAMAVTEITSALKNNAAGIRELSATYVNESSATAVKVTQLISSLGDYYQDGSPGVAILEEEMLTQASYSDGLRAQYTLKVQAGGALAGFGLSAEESTNGDRMSAFIIHADKFAIVNPLYSGPGGVTKVALDKDGNPQLDKDGNQITYKTYSATTLDAKDGGIPFGVDANGIYMNTNVYVRGTMRVDTAGKTLTDGLRGSVNIQIPGNSWNSTAARQAVWVKLWKTGPAPGNNHLVIGDTVTICSDTTAGNPPAFIETRSWFGSAWEAAGVSINGNLLVEGSIAANKIDTRGLTIKDQWGNVIFGSGTSIDWDSILSGVGGIKNSEITLNANGTLSGAGAGAVTLTGLGAKGLATKDNVTIGTNVYFPNGAVMNTSDFVNKLSKINSGTISSFMDGAAITNAYIGNAAIETLSIAGNAVTVPASMSWSGSIALTPGQEHVVTNPVGITFQQPGFVFFATSFNCANFTDDGGGMESWTYFGALGEGMNSYGANSFPEFSQGSASYVERVAVPAGTHYLSVKFRCLTTDAVAPLTITRYGAIAMGVMR